MSVFVAFAKSKKNRRKNKVKYRQKSYLFHRKIFIAFFFCFIFSFGFHCCCIEIHFWFVASFFIDAKAKTKWENRGASMIVLLFSFFLFVIFTLSKCIWQLQTIGITFSPFSPPFIDVDSTENVFNIFRSLSWFWIGQCPNIFPAQLVNGCVCAHSRSLAST